MGNSSTNLAGPLTSMEPDCQYDHNLWQFERCCPPDASLAFAVLLYGIGPALSISKRLAVHNTIIMGDETMKKAISRKCFTGVMVNGQFGLVQHQYLP